LYRKCKEMKGVLFASHRHKIDTTSIFPSRKLFIQKKIKETDRWIFSPEV